MDSTPEVTGSLQPVESAGVSANRSPVSLLGVGAVRKPDEKAYRRFETYEIVDPGKRTLRRGKDWIEFGHTIKAAGCL